MVSQIIKTCGDLELQSNTSNITLTSTNVNIDSDLIVTGNTTLGNGGDTIVINGNLDISGATLTTALGITSGGTGNTTEVVLLTGDQSISGINTFTDTTDASSSTVGGLIISGGLAVAKSMYTGASLNVGTTLNVAGAVTLTSVLGISSGGTGSTVQAMLLTGDQSASGIKTFSDVTDALSSTEGGFITMGGIAIAKKMYIGTDLNVAENTTLGDNSADTITISGKVISTNRLMRPTYWVTFTGGATFTFNFAAYEHFIIPFNNNAAGITLANPINITAGQSGSITFTGTGTNTITTYGSAWKFATLPTILNGRVTLIFYYVYSSSVIYCMVCPTI